MFGKYWIPAECDVSIRPGWFYHKEEDEKVKSPATLFNLYLQSVGRGATLLLNVPPDGRGLIHSNDSIALAGFHNLLENNFSNNLASKASKQMLNEGKKSIMLTWNKPTDLNCVVLKELIAKGQAVSSGHLEISGSNGMQQVPFTTIGRKRVITFPSVAATSIKIIIDEAKQHQCLPRLKFIRLMMAWSSTNDHYASCPIQTAPPMLLLDAPVTV
jgi:alpha-L-fucosidase